MANLSSMRIAELSTLSNLAYTKTSFPPVYGWTLSDEYSTLNSPGFSATTYRRGNEFVIAFRGTDSISDIGADASFVFRQWSTQFEKAAQLINQIRDEVEGAKIQVTGHSLGGGIAQIMAKMFNLSGASFDAPGARSVTNTRGYLEAKEKYAGDIPEVQESSSFINYRSSGSLISSVGQHIGQTEILSPTGSSFSSITIISIFALFAGGPVSILSLAGFFIGNVNRTHPVTGMERTMWVNALLEEQLSLDRGNLVETQARRSDIPELLALGGKPNDEVRVFRDRFTNAVQATLTREAQGFVLRSGDMTEKVTLIQAPDGAFDCRIERVNMPPTTCRLRFDPLGVPRVEVDTNDDGLPEQIVESGRDDKGWVMQKTSFIDRNGDLQASEEIHASDDGLQKLMLFDRDGDGLAEERRQIRLEGDDAELTSVSRLNAGGEVQSELLLRSETGRQLTVYEWIVNGQTVNQGFISQPVDDDLVARLSGLLGAKPDLRSVYAFDGELADSLILDAWRLSALTEAVANRLIDRQLESFVALAEADSLGSFPELLPSALLTKRIGAELAQFRDRSALEIRVNLDDELLLVGSDRMVLIRGDGSVRRQIIEERQAQRIENLDADGFLVSTVRTASPGGAAGNRGIRYDFNYRDGSFARIEMALSASLGEFASVTLNSDELTLEASYANGKLAGLSKVTIDGRELSPAAAEGLSMQLAGLSAGELHSAFQSRRLSATPADDVALPASTLSDALEGVRTDLVAATDHIGRPIYLSREERSLQAITNGVSSLIDGLSILNAIRTGQPIPIVASGLRLAAGLDMLDGSRDLPLLGGAASAAGTVLSLYGLAQALKEGDGVAALSSAAYATAGIAETAAFLQKAGVIESLPSSLSAAGNSLNAALPYISLVNSIAHGDKTGVAVALSDLVLMKVVGTYTVPVIGWAYAIFSLVDSLFTEIPDPWGNARFVWRNDTLVIDSAGETGGEEAVRNVMQTVLASMNSLIERAREQNPGSQLGIIANRMPGLIMAMDGYRFSDIDGLSGAERNPDLRFDTNGRPYNAATGSSESFIGLVEAIIRSALARDAIAPLWEVRTAALQTAAGDPKAGLREEERAGSDGLLAATVHGPDQVFRPVVLDLDGDGIDRIAREQGLRFDIDDSGFRKRTGWIGSDDAFLVIDRNYNGQIDGGREMFSNAVVALARRGLAGMAWIDADYDGRITVADPVWDELRLWRDFDGDASQDEGELLRVTELGISELNYAMGTYTRHAQQYPLSSPNLDADSQGLRAQAVPQGILIEASEDRRLSLLVTRIDDKTAVEAGRDGVSGIEDVELLIDGRQLLDNDLLGGFSGRSLQIESLLDFRHGTGFIDANGIVHFQPQTNHAGEGAGFDYIARASNGQTGRGRVDVVLAPVNDAPTLGGIQQDKRLIYGYAPGGTDPWTGESDGSVVPIYEPFWNQDSWGQPVLRDTPVAEEATGTGRVLGADIDDAADSLRYELIGLPQYGAVTVEQDGRFNYTSWKAPDTPSDRVLLNGQYAAWKDGALYNRDNMYGPAVYPDQDAFQVRITDPQGASSVVTVSVPHFGPYLPPTPPSGGGKKPIAIDLDADGFEFVNVDDSDIFFDVTGDGWKRRTSWVGKDDGLLAIDINGDGKIDRPDEISFASRVEGAQTDLEGMAAFDTHADGLFDSRDKDWSRFGIWQDANQNGLTDPGEFHALAALGVQAVQLASDGRFRVINGQTVHGIGRLTMADGSERALADVTLAFSHERQMPGQQQTRLPISPFSPSGSRIEGSDEADLIPGRHGSDVIDAGAGNDLIIDDAGNDLVTAGDGKDTVFTGNDHDLVDGGSGDDVVQTGPGDDMAFGGDGDDVILLQQGNDIAFGGAGDDLIAGEEGNDVLSGDDDDDQLFGGDGADALFGRQGNDSLYGMEGNDLLDGGDGDDLLDGGAGADHMAGGAGDDRYVVDDAGDTLTEAGMTNAEQGSDTVMTTLDGYRLDSQIEHLELLDTRRSAAPRTGFGNRLDNRIIGNSENNVLYSEGGDDLIDGRSGADLMIGAAGNDTYEVDDAGDRVIESADEGMDTIRSAISIVLPEHVERLLLTGTDSLSATGNALDNALHGNSGDNLLDGGAGADMMSGGQGNDIYRVDQDSDKVVELDGQGIDTIVAARDWRLASYVENLVLTDADALKGFGNELDNLLHGNRGSNLLTAGAGKDLLVGGQGNDVLDGGVGDDTYRYERGDGLDRVIDAAGRDRLRFGQGIGASDIVVRLVQRADGPQAQLRLLRSDGEPSDAEGLDIALAQGQDCRWTPVIEELEFSDGRVMAISELLTTVRRHDLHPKFTNLSAGRDDDLIFGNQRNNRLAGGMGNDALFGEGGEDTLSGDAGNDFLAGGRKNDTLYTSSGFNLIAFNRRDGHDVVIGSESASNVLSLGGGLSTADIALRRERNDLIIDLGRKDGITLRDWYAGGGQRHLTTMQIIREAPTGQCDPSVQHIDFDALASRFDADSEHATVTSPWALTAQRLAAHLSTGAVAIGGELALEYAARGRVDLPAATMADSLFRLDPKHAGQGLMSAGQSYA